MLKIGAFSKITRVSVKTLRHYDKIGLLVAAHTDASSGYRFYRLEQIDRMNSIQRLKRYGFSLDAIRELLALSDPEEIARALLRQRERLRAEQKKQAAIIREIDARLLEFERTGAIMENTNTYVIEVKEATPQYALSKRAMMGVDAFGAHYARLFERIPKEHVTPTGVVGARYFDEVFDPDASDVELFIGIREEKKADITIGGMLCAVTLHRGAYETLSEAYGSLVAWMAEHDYEACGAPYEIYRKTEFDGLPPEAWETEVYFPIRKQ